MYEKEIEIVAYADPDIINENGFYDNSCALKTKNATASFNKIIFDKIQLTFGELTLDKNTTIKVETRRNTLEMHFIVSGCGSVKYAESNVKADFSIGQHNLLYIPDKEYIISTKDEDEKYYSFRVMFNKKFAKKLISRNFPELKEMKRAIEEGCFFMLNREYRQATAEMKSIITEIINCKREGELKAMFFNSKITKLLLLQIEQFIQLNQAVNHHQVKTYDIEKIHYSKMLIDQNISKSISVIELARRSGINDFKLKSGFKEVFGNTVQGYRNEIRMLEAKKLLLNTDKSITEISSYCGYRFIQNFTKAFTQQFGVSPKNFRNSI